MTSCCNARGCDRIFGERLATRAARRYRKRGLDGTARRIVEFVESGGVDGATVLEIGGGVGAIGLELLERGAARAVNLELSPAYEPEARRLFAEAGVAERADWRLHDIAADPDPVETADVVVLHRVVCCYPDYRALLDGAASRARRIVVFSHPPRHALSRLVVRAQNAALRLLRREFQTYVHPPAAMSEIVERRGFRRVLTHDAPVWQIAGFERS